MNTRDKTPSIPKRNWNWRIWAGFLLALATVPSYMALFVRFPVTRNIPWTSWLMFAAAVWLLSVGMRKAFVSPDAYLGKIMGPILAVISLVVAGFFGYATLYASRRVPLSMGAPKVGAKAPEFTLADTSGKMVKLSTLLSEPMPGRLGSGAKPRGVLLIFYRGYW